MNLNNIGSREIGSLMKEAFESVDLSTLAYIYATSKSELYARDLLASHINLNHKLPNGYFVGREWKRHDLAIVKDGTPILIVEGKANTHFDAANPHKLRVGDKSMKAAAKKDIKKSQSTLKNYYGDENAVPIIFTNLLFGIDLDPNYDLKSGQIGYAKDFRSAIKKSGDFDSLVIQGRSGLQGLLENFGDVSSIFLECGEYDGMRVVLDFYAVKVNNA